jgi:hypothetical protein
MRTFSLPVGLVLMENQLLQAGMRNLSRIYIRDKQWTAIFVYVISQKHDKAKVSVCSRQINVDGISTTSYAFSHKSGLCTELLVCCAVTLCLGGNERFNRGVLSDYLRLM